MQFKTVAGRYDGPEIEKRILDFWRINKVFEESLRQSQNKPLFTFNDGPPTANGRPGIHHVLARTFKDIYPRFRTMQGFHVPRKAGWDTHGLPVEHEIEKELGIFNKHDIEQKIGIAEFTKLCRESVMRYIGEWEALTERMGFWVDLDEAYYTLNNSYIESVWNLLKVIWDKGLIYQDYKVVPYDPRIGATLSSHEVAQGYRETEDPSIIVKFALVDQTKTFFLVWTTTPWTLPSNLALAVGNDIEYSYVHCDDETYLIASSLVESVLINKNYQVVQTVTGNELVGLRYERLFNDLDASGEICRVLAASFVSIDEGTGIVHIAPAYGVDDLELGQKNDLPIIHGVGLDGCFKADIKFLAGIFFKDADPIIISLLEGKGLLFQKKSFKHNYPFGWRTGDPLIYYAKNAWYIRTTSRRDRMVELNQSINWVPQTIRDGRFGNWLENNVDWALSRERFWGTPLPIWTDGQGDFRCIGSLAELESLCGRSLDDVDLHRPSIDEITFKDSKTGREYHRVEEVIDCWFDSGAMSYAQWHYPFENNTTFNRHFPADYICEAIDQTRGWFYSLHAIATLVSDSVAFRNCVCLNHIVDAHGKKMSKSQGNIVNPYDVIDTVGVDSLRWYFLARLAPEAQKRISTEIVAEVASSFVNTLWNTYSFFTLYATLDNVNLHQEIPLTRRPEIDRWILALLYQTITSVTRALESYDAKRAGNLIENFTDQLSNWYIRRNRRRFWKSEAGDDKQSAYLTLYNCLDALHRLIAPFMPFLADEIYQNLVRADEEATAISVHLADWPKANPAWRNDELLTSIAVAQKIVALGRAARESNRIRIRQPLSRMLARLPDKATIESAIQHKELILEELNVKELEIVQQDDQLIVYRLKPNLPRIGSRYGKLIPRIRQTLLEANSSVIADKQQRGQTNFLLVDGQKVILEPEDILIETEAAEGYASSESDGYLVALDTRMTPELEAEGLARELIRTVQETRKQAGLEVSDRIELRVTGSIEIERSIEIHQNWIMAETLAKKWMDNDFADTFASENQIDKHTWTIALRKI